MSKEKDNFPAKIGSTSTLTRGISNNKISDNLVFGNLNIGSTVINLPKYDISMGAEALKSLIERHEKLKEDSPEYLFVLEQLQSKIKNVDPREAIGLDKKLENAGKLVYLNQARIASQKASKVILKLQHVKSYQIIFNHILGLTLTRFNSHILPLIREGVDDVTLRIAINSTIIEPLYHEISMAGGNLTVDLVEGMLYFLTEKCHVEWV
jgi:hypothetical protein